MIHVNREIAIIMVQFYVQDIDSFPKRKAVKMGIKNFEKRIEFKPAYDKRCDDPNKNCGICSMRIWFILKGRKGAVQIMLYTDWYLPETIEEYKRIGNKGKTKPSDLRGEKEFLKCFDVGYHSPKPLYKGQICRKCDILDTKKCYYDGSSLRGEYDKIVDKFLRKGSGFIWKYLEKYYYETFGEKK